MGFVPADKEHKKYYCNCYITFYFPGFYRHVIWASSSAGKSTFPGLADAYAKAESSGESSDWDKVHYHLSVLCQAIDGAANTLVDVI